MILITGGAGYIGSHCALSLLAKKTKVVIFDNLSTGHIETIQTLQKTGDLEFFKGDLKNYSDVERLFNTYPIEAVIHFAASLLVGESVLDPQKYYLNNLGGTLNLLKGMLNHQIKRLVFSSTAAVYGEPCYTPIDEKHPLKPVNPYGYTKLCIENILEDYSRAYDLRSVKLRYFNVIGGDSEGRVGEWHEPETHLIPNIFKSLLNKGAPFELWGDDYKTKDGTCIRDYVNVEDLAKAHLLALNYLQNGGATNYFNLGTGQGNTVKEILTTCEKVTGQPLSITVRPRRAGDPMTLMADNHKINTLLGWTPTKTLEESILTAYRWEQKLAKLKTAL